MSHHLWKLEAIVPDKHVTKVMMALAGLTSVPSFTPLINAEVDKGGKARAATSAGTLPELFSEHVKKNRLKQITPKEVQAFLKAAGRSPDSYSYVIQTLQKQKLLRRKPSGEYQIVK